MGESGMEKSGWGEWNGGTLMAKSCTDACLRVSGCVSANKIISRQKSARVLSPAIRVFEAAIRQRQ
eukprot:4751394-Pleurochrysis_carterae.AAC.1